MTKKEELCEVARSFSFKLNIGNYQTVDFFCSQKAEVAENEAEKKSEQLYEFVKSEVMKSVNKYIIESLEKVANEKKIDEGKAVKKGNEFLTRLEKERAEIEEAQDKNREEEGIERANQKISEVVEQEKSNILF